MVDAINGGGKPITNVNDIYVNWKKCTVDQVLKYEKDGREVPSDILKWAEEIAKIADAPEDVTYEATNGSTDVNEIMQTTENKKSTNTLSAAQNERQELKDDGTNLYDQGKIFIDKSEDASNENMKMIASTTQNATSAEVIAGQAEAQAAATETKTKATKKEYDELVNKAQDKNGQGLSIGEQARLVNLGQQLNQIGTSSQNKLQDMSTQVAVLDQTLAAFKNTPTNALDYGAETALIGAELLKKNKPDTANDEAPGNVPLTDASTRAEAAVKDMKEAKKAVNIFASIFNKKIKMGLKAGEQGIATVNDGKKGNEALDTNQEKINESKTKIKTSQKQVGDVTLVKAKTNENNKTETNDETNKDETKTTDKAQDETVKNQDKTLADPTITADANEILKRKERKGIPL